MKKFLAVLLLSLVVSSSACAGGIETTTLFDRKSNPDTSILVGADAEQKARYFPDGKTPDMFIHGNEPPIRRNRLITRILYYSKDMESFATGLKRIQDACDASGCKVEFHGDNYGFTVRFHRHCGEGWGELRSFAKECG